MIDLANELSKAYHGDPWHGSNTLDLLLKADAAKVFTHPIPNAHSIAELVLHLTAWTEETAARIQGNAAKEPTLSDWPAPEENSADEWMRLLDRFKEANEGLIDLCRRLDHHQWNVAVKDERNPALGTGVDNAELINGLVQHHAYHSGQIALLLKF